jgi:tripartite-type tricarboxylate transporter receptor subunit TctC
MSEAGMPGFTGGTWFGVLAPAGTPAAIVAKLNAEAQRMLALPDVKERLAKEGAEPMPGPPERLGTLIQTDLAGWKKLIADANLQLE